MAQINIDDLDYEDLVELLSNLPMTFYPALLGTMVEQAYAHNAFQPGGATSMMRRVEEKIGQAVKVEGDAAVKLFALEFLLSNLEPEVGEALNDRCGLVQAGYERKLTEIISQSKGEPGDA